MQNARFLVLCSKGNKWRHPILILYRLCCPWKNYAVKSQNDSSTGMDYTQTMDTRTGRTVWSTEAMYTISHSRVVELSAEMEIFDRVRVGPHAALSQPSGAVILTRLCKSRSQRPLHWSCRTPRGHVQVAANTVSPFLQVAVLTKGMHSRCGDWKVRQVFTFRTSHLNKGVGSRC